MVLHSNVEGQEHVLVGTEVVFTGERGGSYQGNVAIHWERENLATGERTVIEGANEMEYRFEMSVDSANYRYYIILTPVE